MKYNVLIIDDIQPIRAEIRRVLKQTEIKDVREYEFYEASNIGEANEALLKDQFDVVIVDMKLEEGEEGMIAIENHRRWNPSAVIIVYTAYPTLQNCVKAVKWGAWNYIDKNDALKEYRDESGRKIPSIQILSKSVIEGVG